MIRVERESGDRDYEKLIWTLLVYEDRDRTGLWSDINPFFAQAIQLK